MAYLDKLREHSFDDIQEFDNYLPRWWLWSFYLACIFAAVYWLYYHGSTFGMSSTERFEVAWQAKLDRDALTKPITAEMLLEMSKQPKMVEEGRGIFETLCVPCHLKDGSGSVGPNLTDKYWLHGGRIDQIYKTVTDGVPAKGMVAWEPVLGKSGCQKVVAYLYSSIKGTDKKGKPPEGEPEKN